MKDPFFRGLLYAVIVFITLVIAANYAARAIPGVIVIDDDFGGSVGTYVEWWTRVKDAQVPVRFRGMCISACTVGLSLPSKQVCVEPTASFGFHLARDDKGPDPAFTQAMIRRFYPAAVQKWLKDRQLTLERITFMDAKTVVDLGVMRWCPVLND